MIKKTSKRITSVSIRENAKRDRSPRWDGCESWDATQFANHFRSAMQYYRLESSGKDLKPQIIKWMQSNGYKKADIDSIKRIKDSRISVTTGAVADCLLRGMPTVRKDFNNGKDSSDWLKSEISSILNAGKNDVAEPTESTPQEKAPTVNIQERVRESAMSMTEEIEEAIESYQTDPEKFDPKAFKVLNLLKGKQAKAAHARHIKEFYGKQLKELELLASGKGDDQLREGYSHRSKKQIRKFIEFLKEIDSACTMLAEEAKVTRKPRTKKAVSKDKLVEKLKFMKTETTLKLVSINPVDIIGAKELWCYNTKTRKLGKYVAADYAELGIKGTSIINFNEDKSIQKTLRKPADQLKAFKDAGKVALRKFLDEINAVDTKLTGRINEDILLLKVA